MKSIVFIIATLLYVLTVFAKEVILNQVNVRVRGDYIYVDGKSYPLDKNVKVENVLGEPVSIQSLEYARAIKLEFDQKGAVRLIKILGWWD